MKNRKLVLRSEQLAELADSELEAVAGGQPVPPSSDCPDNTYYCITGPGMCGNTRIICW